MSTAAKTTTKARLEARIDVELDEMITEAADRLNVTKTAFISEAIRDAALKVIARADITMMAPEIFDTMMATLDTAEDSPELEDLAALPRRIDA